MKIIVKPKYERSRWFRDLVRAMRFAEAARHRQGPPTISRLGVVEVHIYHGRTPHIVASYGQDGKQRGVYRWIWAYAT